jgi:response regulator of citrate/malate metabolism
MDTRVLIVEDDPLVARVNRGMVAAEPGFEVVGVAATLFQAHELFLELRPELLLVDVHLPDGNGLDLIPSLRGSWPFEAIMITAANDLSSVQQALHGGVLDYLIKPFQKARLQEALRRYQSRAALSHQASLNQTRLDKLLGHKSELRLPKGIDAATLGQIRQLMEHTPELLTAEEVGERVGVSRVTAWRYLEYLQEVGAVRLEQEYGGVGRPIKRYGAVEARSGRASAHRLDE